MIVVINFTLIIHFAHFKFANNGLLACKRIFISIRGQILYVSIMFNKINFFSGFEHVFIGEFRDSGVQGFHNWYSFYLQEKQGLMDYFGYIDNTDFGHAVRI